MLSLLCCFTAEPCTHAAQTTRLRKSGNPRYYLYGLAALRGRDQERGGQVARDSISVASFRNVPKRLGLGGRGVVLGTEGSSLGTRSRKCMPEEGLEPSRDCSHRILSASLHRGLIGNRLTIRYNPGFERALRCPNLPMIPVPDGKVTARSDEPRGGPEGTALLVGSQSNNRREARAKPTWPGLGAYSTSRSALRMVPLPSPAPIPPQGIIRM